MRKLFYPILLLFPVTGLAQRDFEGMIKYTGKEPVAAWADEKERSPMEITVWFGHRSILISNKMRGEEQDILVLVDSARVYTMDKSEKTYEERKLAVKRPKIPVTREIIAGHAASPVQGNQGSLPPLMLPGSVFWYADSLFFQVPEKYEINEELLMVSANRIMLKARIGFDFGRYEYGSPEDTVQPMQYTEIVATEIIPKKIPASLFRVPEGYTKEERYSHADTTTTYTYPLDTVAVIADTIRMEPVKPEKPVSEKGKTPPSKPVKSKGEKSPIKKEEP